MIACVCAQTHYTADRFMRFMSLCFMWNVQMFVMVWLIIAYNEYEYMYWHISEHIIFPLCFAVLQAAVYDKCLRLMTSSVNEGQIINLMTVDIMRVVLFFNFAYYVWALPIQVCVQFNVICRKTIIVWKWKLFSCQKIINSEQRPAKSSKSTLTSSIALSYDVIKLNILLSVIIWK